MSYFDLNANSEQKFIVENNIKHCTRFRCFWSKSEKEKRDDIINSFNKQISIAPEKVYKENIPVKYFVTVSDSSVKINGTDMYNASFDPFIDNDIFGVSVNNCFTFLTSIDKKTKDTLLGDINIVILDSTVNGLMGKKVGQNGLHYMQCIPNIFKYTIHLIFDDELNKHYLDVIMKNSESLDYVLKMI